MSREQQILSLLRKSQQGFTPKEVAETLNLDANRIRKVLRRMTGKGLLSNPKRGFYRVKVTESDKSDIESDKVTSESNIKSNMKVTRVIEEKVTKGGIERDKVTNERDKRDIESDKGYITLPVSDARKRTTLDLKNHTIVLLNWKKTCLGRTMSDLVDEAVQKQWGKPS